MPQHDVWDDAMVDEPVKFAGQVSITLRNVLKGKGNIEYDPQIHGNQQTNVLLEFTIEPLGPTRKLIQCKCQNWTPQFRQVIRPSVEALVEKIAAIRNLQTGQFNPLKMLVGLWIIGEYVPRPDNKPARKGPNGENLPAETWTTIRFVDVFSTFEECQAAYGVTTEPAPVADSTPPPPVADPQKAAMAAFLPALWAQAGKDITKFAALLNSNPLLSGHFTMQSPEVIALTGVPF